MSRAEQVERVLAATVTNVHLDGSEYTYPLIETGELWLSSREQLVTLVRRILAAGEGSATNFTTVLKPPPPPVYRARRKRNLEANAAYRNRRRITTH